MILAVFQTEEIWPIVAGVIIIIGFVVWRIRMGRKDRGEERENPD